MPTPTLPVLPITEVIDDLTRILADADEVVLQAPPGAGKTTIVPLALLQQAWLAGRKILVLEPRRMAARAAAGRMAQILGEEVGATVGYRIRLDSCVSANTAIEVITEGILTRRLQSDPGLEDVGLVIFDEYHERSLDSDLCLALCLQGREMFREGTPLKLLVMSATLDGGAVADLLGGAEIVTSGGRQFPVESHYLGLSRLRESVAPAVAAAVMQALQERTGNILVFLPGQREISAVGQELARRLRQRDIGDVSLAPLYGGLSLERQQRAIEAPPEGRRKVVLSTNVAETSLTIEGIHVVVDSGLVREAMFDPSTGVTRLTTRRISQASAEQRQGRAGRLAPGHCYRLWSEEQQHRLVKQSAPEIRHADLAPFALQLLAWGVHDPAELNWLDAPPEAAWSQALNILEQSGAVFCNRSSQYQLTPHGVRIAQMPLHPRLAHMLMVGCDIHASETACLLAAVLSERNPVTGGGADISHTLAVLMGQEPCQPAFQGWFKRTWQQARRFARIASDVHKPRRFALSVPQEDVLGVLLSSAWPDRVARRRENGDDFLLSNGRSAQLPPDDALAAQEWLAVADLGGQAGSAADRIYSAAGLNPACFNEILSTLVRDNEIVVWDEREERLLAQRQRRIGSILLSSEPLAEVPEDLRQRALLGVVERKGLGILPWTPYLEQWRARIQLLHGVFAAEGSNPWPDLSDQGLLQSLEHWLLPWLGEVRRLADFKALDLKSILLARLPWPLPLDLERLAPERLGVPSGSSIPLDYARNPPVLAVKLQEMFGCEETPTVADGRVAVQVHLMSPAGRPLQVTQDLASFWRNSYQEVRKEMKGRYPKHPWPDNPLDATATRHTRKRAGQV